MHGFQNGLSTPVKLDNWQQLQKFFNKRKLSVPKNLIEDSMKGVPGAAVSLMETLYTILTEKRLPEQPRAKDGSSRETGIVSMAATRNSSRAAGSAAQDSTYGSEPIRQSIQNPPSIIFGQAKVTPIQN